MMADNMDISHIASWQALTSLGPAEPDEHQTSLTNYRSFQDHRHRENHQAIHILSPPNTDYDYFAPISITSETLGP